MDKTQLAQAKEENNGDFTIAINLKIISLLEKIEENTRIKVI